VRGKTTWFFDQETNRGTHLRNADGKRNQDEELKQVGSLVLTPDPKKGGEGGGKSRSFAEGEDLRPSSKGNTRNGGRDRAYAVKSRKNNQTLDQRSKTPELSKKLEGECKRPCRGQSQSGIERGKLFPRPSKSGRE